MSADDLVLQGYISEKMSSIDKFSCFHIGSQINLPLYHVKLVRVANAFKPFLLEYFKSGYQLNQKLVVLKMYQTISVHDETIFADFQN